MNKLFLLSLLQLLSFTAFNQADSCWTVLLLQKGNNLEMKEDMGSVNKTGFYLFRNCIYEVDLLNKVQLRGRLIDVKPDTLFFTNYFNSNVALKAGASLDTVAVHYLELDKLNLIADRAMNFSVKHNFSSYDFHFKMDTSHCYLPSYWDTIFSNDVNKYEIVPHLTSQGICHLFEENGRTFYFQGGGMIKPDRSKMDFTYDRRYPIWFTPCKVELINGIAVGLFTENIKNDPYLEKDSLQINGLNLEITLMRLASLGYMEFSGPYPDSLDFYSNYVQNNIELIINGVNISLFGTINEAIINGVNLAGLNTVVDKMNGFSISGLNNFSYIMNGMTVALFRNRATKGKGVQIGLFNKCNDFRGFQIGIWNINGKRSLPFINWQFSAKPE